MNTTDPIPPHPIPASALGAFVHGIVVRSWVLAREQTGDDGSADRLVSAAIARFAASAASLPLAQWPITWWSALLEQRGMLAPALPGDPSPLRALGAGARAALLLRLVAGLDLPHAAQALGVGQPAYEAALGQALSATGMDDAVLDRLRARLHDDVHAMSATARGALASLADAALPRHPSPPGTASTAPASPPAPVMLTPAALTPAALTPAVRTPAVPDPRPAATPFASPQPARPARARLMRHGPWIGLGVLAVALAVAWAWRRAPAMPPGMTEALPAEVIAPAPALDPAQVVTHPDYAQITHPDDERLAIDLAFLSWLSASTEPASPAQADAPESPSGQVPEQWRALLAPVADAWPTLDPASRSRFIAQATDWSARDAAARAALVQAVRSWDALPAPDRAHRRAPFTAWRALADGDRARISAAASHYAARSIAEQTDLRLQFAALPDDTQKLWRLGPALGPELTAMAPLFAFLPEDERPELLSVLRSLDIDARRDLAVLAPRLGEAERAILRRELSAAPAAQRAALIRARLAQ